MNNEKITFLTVTERKSKNGEGGDILHVRIAEAHKYVVFLLGGRCVKCGYKGEALDIDHIRNNGRKERDLPGYTVFRQLRRILKGSEEYQLLCRNCNWEKEVARRKKAKEARKGK